MGEEVVDNGSETAGEAAIGTYLLLGLSNDGGEDSLGGIFTGQTGLASTGTIVNDDGGLELHGDKIQSKTRARSEGEAKEAKRKGGC